MYDYDRRAPRTAAESPKEILKQINKVRASVHGNPLRPLTMNDLHPIIQATDDLDKKLRDVFGHDCRLIVLGNGVHIRN